MLAAGTLDPVIGHEIVGRNVRKDSSSDLLLKQALLEVDQRTILDRIMPEFFKLSKTFEQADVNIKPSALFGISLALAAVGGIGSVWAVNMYVAPIGASPTQNSSRPFTNFARKPAVKSNIP